MNDIDWNKPFVGGPIHINMSNPIIDRISEFQKYLNGILPQVSAPIPGEVLTQIVNTHTELNKLKEMLLALSK